MKQKYFDENSENYKKINLSENSQRGNILAAKCHSRNVLKHISSKWGILILIVLQSGTHRFADLRKKIEGISERMLSQTLQLLEKDGIVNRKSYNIVPPHVEYTLTPLGQEISKKVRDLTDWIEINLPEIKKHNNEI